MKKPIAIAIGTLFTALAPAAFAEHYGSAYSRDYGHSSSDRDRARDEYRASGEYRTSNEYRTSGEYRGRDTARVLESRPVQSAAGSKQECWNPRAGHYEELRSPAKTSVGKGAAIGAVTGGVLGHQVDQGGGTAAGAILGGLLGHQLERRNDRDDQPDLDKSRCRYVSAGLADGIEGYDVRYEYGGREYVTRLTNDPGDRLRLGRDINSDGSPF